jgi:hypothetical protein
MTNNTPSAMPALAEALLAADADPFEALDLLKPELTPEAFSELALLLDVCPIHYQDLEICADDDILADTLSDLSTPPSTAGYDVPLTACRHLR